MKLRRLLVATAFLAAVAGGVIVYLALSVPNDLRADALLAEAKKEIAAGRPDQARQSLSKVIQQHPRTDAASAATVALVTLAQKDHDEMATSINLLRKKTEQQATVVSSLQKRVAELEKKPPPPAPVIGPPKPEVKKATPPKKKAPVRRRRR